MRSPIRRACAVNCVAVGFEFAIFYKYQAKTGFSTLERCPIARRSFGSHHNRAQPAVSAGKAGLVLCGYDFKFELEIFARSFPSGDR